LLHTSHTCAPSPHSVLGVAQQEGKGDLAELKVATDLVSRGYKIALAYGEDWDYDLIVCRDGETLERVQVKYARSDGSKVCVRTRSHSLTNGKVRRTKRLTSEMIDWLAVYDAVTDTTFYIPAVELGTGMNEMTLRLTACLNGQLRGIHAAENYRVI
jgi:PD-(D/E)XK endonuclease